MERDYDYTSARHAGDLESIEKIGRSAGERAVKRLNPRKVETRRVPVVYDPRVAGSLVGHLASAINGASIARKTSFLRERMGERLFPKGIRIVDDPLRPRGLRSKPFDGEGLPTAARDLVSAGRLTGWLMDSASARQLGRAPTGHAVRGVAGPPGAGATNVHIEPGAVSKAELIGDIVRGIYVTELIGQGVNGVTGDYSRGASGFLIENGEIGAPVAEITIAGNLIDMYRNLAAADDLEFRHSVNVPTLRIDGMTIAGA